MAWTVLFVCTGNSCRSVMAQGLLEDLLRKQPIRSAQEIVVRSAGIGAVDGMSASTETARLLKARGIDVSRHCAARVTESMVREADRIFVMEDFQREDILTRCPGARDKVALLKTFDAPPAEEIGSPNIPDPIGKPAEVYEVCFATIEDSVRRVHRWLTRQLPKAS